MSCKHLTIQSPIEYEITVQRSRFITSLRIVKTREDVDYCLKEINKLYPRATHYCWAYRFTGTPVLEHCSDDGEPAGTAGRPILGALKKKELLNVLAVVTRYYGGIKLGVKGLIAAYGESTSLALEESQIILSEPQLLIKFTTDYELYNTFLARLKNIDAEAEVRADFTDRISGEFIITSENFDTLKNELDNISPTGRGFEYKTSPIE